MSDSESCEEEIEIPYDQIVNTQDFEILEAKLGNLTRIQTKEFRNESYQPEENIKMKDQKGDVVEKIIPFTNYLRWRYSKKETETEEDDNNFVKKLELKKMTNKKVETNAKIIEWDDGTFQLVVGDEFIDINPSEVKNTRIGIINKEKEVILVGKSIDKKYILRASEYDGPRKRESIPVINKITAKDEEKKVKLAFSYYDKNEYNKDEFGGKYGKPKFEKKKKDTKNDIIIPTHFKHKRHRNESQHD